MVIGIQDEILKINSQHLLDRLLMDKTTKSNIIWATDAYTELGTAYHRDKEITVDLITGQHSGVIKNRARKALEQQSGRTRKHAEVFTPLWICDKMNDHIDEMWFGRKQGIHKTDPETGHIVFTSNKKWRYYVDSRRLEITCGEAPSLLQKIAGCAVKLNGLVLQTKFFQLIHLSVKPVQITLLWLSIKH